MEAEGLQHRLGKVDAGDHLVLNLAGSAEDVRVVLRKAAHAQQAVHGSRALVAIDVAQLGQAHRQVAVTLRRVLVDQDVAGAVHRLQAILGIIQFHGGVHIARVKALMAADLPQLAAHHVGREDQRVAAPQAFLAHPVFHHLADDAALGMPEDESRAGQLLNAEEVQLLAQQAMVALGRFFQAGKVRVHVLLREERRAVDALQLRILLVAQPVSAGQAGHLDGLDAAGRGHVRPAAKVHELAVAIKADLVAGRGEFGHEVGLHEVAVACKLFQRLLSWSRIRA